MSAAGSEVAVLIATRGESDLLEATLAEVRRQSEALGAELVLVVNRPAEALPVERIEGWRRLCHRLLFEPRPGKSLALNTGLAAISSPIVAFCDDDALPWRHWLERLTAPLRDRRRGLAGTGGRVIPVYPTGGPPRWYRQLIGGRESSFLGPLHDLGPEERDYPAAGNTSILPFGANCAYRRDALPPQGYHPDLGPSPRTGLRGGEDTLVAIQVQAAGGRLRYLPDAVVHHPVPPERLREEFVAAGFRKQGIEVIRFHRAAGLPMRSLTEARRRARRYHRRALLNRWLRPRRALLAHYRALAYEGMVEELAGGVKPG